MVSVGGTLYRESRGCHCRYACTTICDRGQNALTNLDRKFLLLHCICTTILGFRSDISLDLDQFYRKYQRDIVAWLLTMENISIWPLTFVLTAVADCSTEAVSVTPPWRMYGESSVSPWRTYWNQIKLLVGVINNEIIISNTFAHQITGGGAGFWPINNRRVE